MSNPSWICWLDEAQETDGTSEADGTGVTSEVEIALVGGKGANLRRLVRLGLPVPPGFVVTTQAYRTFLGANQLDQQQATAESGPDPSVLAARTTEAAVPDELRAAILAAYQHLSTGAGAGAGAGTPLVAVAVRSSGTAEDLATASFAGQHDTFLNISGPETLLSAVRACWASLWTPRAIAYRRQRSLDDQAHDGTDDPGQSGPIAEGLTPMELELGLAVVVQVMVPAEVAGVAFTANPITGVRTEATVSAVHGLGERLVSGEGASDEWVVRGVGTGARATLRRGADTETGRAGLTAEQVFAIASLARRIEGAFGGPQDVEWAMAGGQLFVLQARPMTALPEPVTWAAPGGGGWMRNFRLGEWLPEPVTPLCESWLLARIEQGEVDAEERDFGLRPRLPYHVLANGWYFSSPIGGGLPLPGVATALTRHPLRIAALVLSTNRPDVADRLFIARVARRWREVLLPRYQRLVTSWELRIETASPAELIQAIDAVGAMAGQYLWDLSVVGGHAWKAEHALARFCRRHLPNRTAQMPSHQALLLGLPLPTPFTGTLLHAVQSLDWIRPTLGEAFTSAAPQATTDLARRRSRLEQQRRAAELAYREALAGRSTLRRRFDRLLALAQRYAILREEQAAWFTLGWPLLRRAALQLGDELRMRGVIQHTEDVFFLTRAEVATGLGGDRSVSPEAAGDLRAAVGARRQQWERQRRLSPPLVLGRPLGARVIARAADAMRTPTTPTTLEATDHLTRSDGRDVLRGMPASPGRASGPVRIVRGPDDFARFLPGEVLVAQVTAPAWTPLFSGAAAVVTDGGSLAAHASLVAREFGIPAVVGVGDATARLRDGQHVTVDGSAGIIEVAADEA